MDNGLVYRRDAIRAFAFNPDLDMDRADLCHAVISSYPELAFSPLYCICCIDLVYREGQRMPD